MGSRHVTKKTSKPQPKSETTTGKPDTVITLTLPGTGGISRTGSLLIKRGDLAKICQFHYTNIGDIASAISDAQDALAAIEASPPVIPDLPPVEKPKPEPKAAAHKPPVEQEPTIDIPLRKGKRTVKASYMSVAGGEASDLYFEALRIAGRLIDGGLWDGKTPICIDDPDVAAKKMEYLTDKDFSLFSLEDFVQIADISAVPEGEPTV